MTSNPSDFAQMYGGSALPSYPLSGHFVLDKKLRVDDKNPDKPMFVARDVAVALGYKKPENAVRTHCKNAITTPKQGGGFLTFIPESDVLRLIVKSKLPAAQEFERRVFEEILPTIRKHGMYATPDTLDKMLADPDFGIRMLETVKAEREKSAALEAEIVEQAPKVEYAETTTENMTRFKLTSLADAFEVRLSTLTKWLITAGILRREIYGGQYRNLPTDRAFSEGYAVIGVHTVNGAPDRGTYRFTQAGFDEVHRIVINNQEAF